jgi:hypothetical protein
MEWTIRLEPKVGWGEMETVELVSITRPVLAATAGDVGLSLAEAKSLMARLQEAKVRALVHRGSDRAAILPLRLRHAIQIQHGLSSSYPESALPCAQLAGLRGRAEAA